MGKEINLNNVFEKDQLEEIKLGKEAGIDVMQYAKPQFLAIQMRQIRLGLMENLDVACYTKPEYDWFQMEELREGLKAGVAVSTYANPSFSFDIMRQIRLGLQKGIDLSRHTHLDSGVLKEMRLALEKGIDIVKYIKEGYDAEQLHEIRLAIENKVEIEPYLSLVYLGASLAEIRMGLEKGIDVSVYAKPEYQWRQMRELRLGMENRVDVSLYSHVLFSWRQMREVRTGLELGLNVSSFARLCYTSKEMAKIKTKLLEEVCNGSQEVSKSLIKSDDIEVEISKNDMEAYVKILNSNRIITKSRLLDIFEMNHIQMGIIDEVVTELVQGLHNRKAVLVARGQIPKRGTDGYYEYFFRTSMGKRPKILEDGTADYRNVEWFETVKAGQKIAYYHKAEEGTDGFTVSGRVIQAQKGAEQRILTGKGFELGEDKCTYTATMDGIIRLHNDEIEVSRYFEVDEVTLATGNINIDGSLHIKGNVENGTEIHVTEDLEIDGNVGAATIICGGTVVFKKGMNSSGNGYVRAGRDIICKFFETTNVEAKQDIQVNKCLNSNLVAGGTITSSSIILGGVARAEKGFLLNNVGNSVGLTTVLQINFSDVVKEELRRHKVAILETRRELQILNNSREDFVRKFVPEVRNEMELFIKIEQAISIKEKELKELNETVSFYRRKIKEAKVIIGGMAYEGTIVEIDKQRYEPKNERNIVVKTGQDEIIFVSNS